MDIKSKSIGALPLTFNFDYSINIKFCVADRLDFFNDFNAAFSAYADACACRNDVFKAWIARISDRRCMFTPGAPPGSK